MYSTFTPTPSSLGCGPPQCGVFESACQNICGVSASTAAPAAMRQQQREQQQPLQYGAQQQLQQYPHGGNMGEAPAAGPSSTGGNSPAVNGRRKQHGHRWNAQLSAHSKQVNMENEQAVSHSPKSVEDDSQASPAAAVEKPGFLSRLLLRTGRGAEKRSHSSTQSDRHGQHQQELPPTATGRSLTPPASAPTFSKAYSTTALSSKERSEAPAAHSEPRHRSRHWLHHQKGKQPDQQTWQPQQQQQQQEQQQQQPQQQGCGSRAVTPGTTHHVVQAPCCCSRKSSPFVSATCSVPLRDHQQVERVPGTLATAFPLPTGVPCPMAQQRVFPTYNNGLLACQHGFVRPGHSSFVVNRHTCQLPNQQPQRQHVFVTAGEASCGLGTQSDSLNNGSRLNRRLLPSYTSGTVASGAVPSHMRYGKPSSFVSARSPFSLCSPMIGCFPVPHLFADVSASEGSTAASAFQPSQVAMQPSPSPAAVADSSARNSLVARVTGGRGKAVIDPKAYNTFNVNCFFTQLYLLDSAKRLELIAARISHSMQSRAFSYWVLKHRYSIAKHIWDRKVSKEIEHLRRLRNNIERSRQNYAAETARKRAEADAGTLDKSAELLIIQEQQSEALAQQQAQADEQVERLQRYRTRRGAVLGSLLLEHGLKRLVYEYQSFSLFALRSNLLTDDDILQHAVRMLPKFVPPSWKKLDPTRQAELLRSEYAHLVEPVTIHLTNLREMYRLHRLDLEARSRRLGRYYRRFFGWTRCFTILECIQRSQKRRLLSDAYTMLRYYSWTMRAIEGESLACNATIARLREAREQRLSAPPASNSSNPLVLPSYPRRRRDMCSGCGCIPARCCCCSNITSSVPCRQHCLFPRGTGEEEDTASGTAAALFDSQSDTSVQQQNPLLGPRKAVAGRDEMSGIFFPRLSDGSPMLRRSSRECVGRIVDASSMQQSSKNVWIDATGHAADGSRRGSPREKCSFCSGSSAGAQVSCSCCCGQSQQNAAAAVLSCSSNVGLPSRGTVLSTDMTFSPTTTAVPRACVSCSSPVEAAEPDAAVTAAAAAAAATGTMAATHRQCSPEGRTEEGCTPQASETRWAHISATAKHVGSSSRCLSPACTAREPRRSPRPCSAHDTSDVHIFPAEAGQQHHRQKPERHRSCFIEASASHRLRHRINSPVGQVCFSPKSLACYPGVEQFSSWKQRSAQATPRQQHQENQQLEARGDGSCLQEKNGTFTDTQGTPSRLARGAEGSATAGVADDAAATPQRTSAAALFTSAGTRQAAAHVRAAHEESPYFPLLRPLSVSAGDNYSSSDNVAADISSFVVAAALPSAATDKPITPALQEVERNAALILGVEPQLRSHINVRPVPMAPVTITFKHEKRSLWDDPPKPGEAPEIEKVHIIGRNWSNTQ